MTEGQMEKIDDIVDPIVEEAMGLVNSINKRLPRTGDTMYKRSPVRSLNAAVGCLRRANEHLKGIE